MTAIHSRRVLAAVSRGAWLAAAAIHVMAAMAHAEPGPPMRQTPVGQVVVGLELPRPFPADKTDRLAALAQVGHAAHARHGFGTDPEWLAIMDWRPPSGIDALRIDGPRWTSYERAVERFAVPDGRSDPIVDFAASFALALDDWLWFTCRYPLRARYLYRKGVVASRPEFERCHGLRRWLNSAEVHGVDLVFVAQRWRDASASMGHVLLRFRGASDRAEERDRTVMWVALDPPSTPGYLLKGITGGLRAGPRFETWGEVLTRYVSVEGRDLHIYRLRLDNDERLALLAAVAARTGGGSLIDYAFFTENCATMAWKLLRAVVPSLPEHATWMFHPHELPSELLRSDRARFVETVRARRSRGIDGEVLREDAEAALRAGGWVDAPTEAALEALDGDVDTRAAALRALGAVVAVAPSSSHEAWARWADLTLDVEAFALDAAVGEIRPHTTSLAFEAALALRAAIPVLSAPPASPLPPGTVGPSGSRLGRVLVGARGDRGAETSPRGLLAWDVSVVDEEPGEARLAQFRRSSRIRVLANRLTWSSNGRDVALEENRTVLFETVDRSRGFATEEGALGSRVGSSLAIVTESRPRLGLPFSALVRWGPGLLIAGDPACFDYFTLTAELEAAAFLGSRFADARVRGVARLGFEAAVQLGAAEHRWRTQASAGLSAQPRGFGAEWRVETRLDLTLDRRSGLGLHLAALWLDGAAVGDGWQVLLGLFY